MGARMRNFFALLLISCAQTSAPVASGDELFRDDFSRYPIGILTWPVGQLNPAIQEYHYVAQRGVPLGPWTNSIIYLDPWSAGEENGRPYLE